ncbi:MAG: Uncharacterized protein G01um101493_262, partial [Microgenomates group bacterium Gr01-1014_93]
ESVEIITGHSVISDFKRGTNWLLFKVEATESSKLRLPIYDFPEWKVFIDKKETKFENANDLGQPTFEIMPGEHFIYAKLFNTPIRIFANLVSLLSFILLCWVFFKQWKKRN